MTSFIALSKELELFSSRCNLSTVKSPRCPGYRAKMDTYSMRPAQSITSFLWTNFGQKKDKHASNISGFSAMDLFLR